MKWAQAIDQRLPEPLQLVLRGVSEVFFMNNSVTGLLFLVGIFVANWVAGVAAIIGTICSTVAALILGYPRKDIEAGLFGFNGTLTGIALTFFLKESPQLWIYLIVAAFTSSILEAALMNFLGRWNVPVSTAPFVLITWMFLLAVFAFSIFTRGPTLPPQHLPVASSAAGIITAAVGTIGVFKGVSEVMFQDSVITGVFFLVGIAVADWRGALLALAGAVIGVLVAWSMGANQELIGLGLYGFNPVLTVLAVGSVFLPLSYKSVLFAILAGVVTVVVNASLANFLLPLGLPTLTFPYVLTMWIFIFSAALSKHFAAQPSAAEDRIQGEEGKPKDSSLDLV